MHTMYAIYIFQEKSKEKDRKKTNCREGKRKQEKGEETVIMQEKGEKTVMFTV